MRTAANNQTRQVKSPGQNGKTRRGKPPVASKSKARRIDPRTVPVDPREHPEFAAFDTMPDSALVRVTVVRGLFGCSDASVWRRVKSGALPRPIKLSPRITAWRVGELREKLKATA